MGNLDILYNRTTVPVYVKMKTIERGSSVVNAKKKKEYDFYKCDYCGAEIEIKEKRHEMEGGIAIIPRTITGRGELKLALCSRGELKLALCSKCLKPALKELEKEK